MRTRTVNTLEQSTPMRPLFALPSGAIVRLLPEGLEVLDPGPYAFAVGHVLTEHDQLRVSDQRYLQYEATGAGPAPEHGGEVAHHKALLEQARSRIEPLLGQALASEHTLLVVDRESELLPKIVEMFSRRLPADALTEMQKARGPVVFVGSRLGMAGVVERLADAKGFRTIADQLLATPPKGKVQVVSAIGGRLALFAVPVLAAPGAAQA